MTAAADRAAELRAQAAALDQIGKLEEKAATAKAAYQDNPDDQKAKGKHRTAGQALADARNEERVSRDPRRRPDESLAEFQNRLKVEALEAALEAARGVVRQRPDDDDDDGGGPGGAVDATARPDSARGGATPGEVG